MAQLELSLVTASPPGGPIVPARRLRALRADSVPARGILCERCGQGPVADRCGWCGRRRGTGVPHGDGAGGGV